MTDLSFWRSGRCNATVFAVALAVAPPAVIVEKNLDIAMRDGTVLRGDVYRPDAPGSFPALLKRTPYSKSTASEIPFFHRLASSGFVVAVSDTRGRYTSEGVARPHDEAEDGADTVAWLVQRPYVNGKVGMFGGSYAATTQLTAATLRPDGLVALFPSSSYASRYDMVFQGGAFYLLDGLRWNLGQAVDVRRRWREPQASRDAPVWLSSEASRLVRDRYVWHVPLKTMNVDSLADYAPGYFEMLEHPSHDAYWSRFDIARRHAAIATPALHITGWYDSLLVGTLRNFEGLKERAATESARSGQRLVVGPWTHARPTVASTRIGDVDFGPDAGLDAEALANRWFRYWLLGEENGVLEQAPVKIFLMGENRWRNDPEWPPPGARTNAFYLRAGGLLSTDPPLASDRDHFTYDPWHPVPTPDFEGYSRAPVDTAPITSRDDVLVYTSPPLDAALEVTGYVELVLWVASTAPDTDFTGRLLDVAPDGTARALTDGILRVRYRNGFDEPELLSPGQPAELRIALGATANVFLPEHRIRLEVSSSNFPRFDRNPNTGGVFGEDTELRRAEQTVFLGKARPSRLLLSIVPREPHRPSFGFTADAEGEASSQQSAFASRLSRARISEFHRRLTERPHRAGTEGARVVAEYIATTLLEAGLEVSFHEYSAHLSSPIRVGVQIQSPGAESPDLWEPADPRDPQSAHPELEPGFIAYSASGSVEGEVVYVGYGLPADYETSDLAGKIVLARYGRSHRAVKIATAQEKGAAGILIYSDPEDDGAGQGEVWPQGRWRAPEQIQRGNGKLSWFWHGDPLTPGVAATPDAERLSATEAPTLPKIPAVPLSARAASRILSRLRDGVRVRIDVSMDDSLRAVRNVVAKLPGRREPERWVLLGAHHDAWTFGGVDPGSAASVLMEVAYSLASMANQGWRPKRSILFCFWDAEEYGLIGSTEYAEEHIHELREKAVAYINTDMYNGNRLVAGGTPTLRDFVRDVSSSIPGVEPPAELNSLGSGADFVPFQDYVGLPTLSLEFLGESGWAFGTYHSNYDDRYWMLRHADEDFRQGESLARLLGTAAIRLAEAPVVPYRFSYYAEKLASFVELTESAGAGRLSFVKLRRLVEAIREKSSRLETRIDSALAVGRVPELSDRLMRLEHTLVDETGSAAERWYRHVVYGWNVLALYSGQPLPGLAAAVARGDESEIARERERIEQAFARLSRQLDEILRLEF